jgi:electron transfer flavoprotein alpha/beta subunit
MRAVALIGRPADVALVRAATAIGDTVALTARDEETARPLLAAARAAGAKRLVRVWDPALETTDYLGLAYALAAAVRASGELATTTVILAGDRGRCVIGPAVAERLSIPLLGRALGVELRDGKVVARRCGRDVVRSYSATPPALVCLTLDGSAGTAAAPGDVDDVESWTLSKVGLSAAELSYRKHFAPTPALAPTPEARRFDSIESLLERLRAEGLVRGGEG